MRVRWAEFSAVYLIAGRALRGSRFRFICQFGRLSVEVRRRG